MLVDTLETEQMVILDTCVLLHDPRSIFSFKKSNIVIPSSVIDEIDEKKTRDDIVGKNARLSSRLIEELIDVGELCNGVSINTGSIVYVCDTSELERAFKDSGKHSNTDSVILELAKSYSSTYQNVIVVTRDTNLRIRCSAANIRSETYSSDKTVDSQSDMYSGVTKLNVSESVIDAAYNGTLTIADIEAELDANQKIFPNHIFVLKSELKKSVIVRIDTDKQRPVRVRDEKDPGAWKLRPRNKEQNFALDLLMNRDIQLVTLVGAAGTGKTLLALAAGLGQVMDVRDGVQNYRKLIVTRPIQPLGNDLGFLPGTIDEKMAPWVSPIMDNLKTLMSPDGRDDVMLKMWLERGTIEVEAITYIRGRSIPNAFIIVDEAQNLTAHELKTIITRAGAGTKIVLTGDIEQIDNRSVDAVTNGLTYAIEKFKDQSIAGHVTLIKGERSKLATLASKLL